MFQTAIEIQPSRQGWLLLLAKIYRGAANLYPAHAVAFDSNCYGNDVINERNRIT
ncbi:MAG: hypothetical protein ACI8UO_002052 [Verrucomicrobiales bacterium]|jgi:hypothetical protein